MSSSVNNFFSSKTGHWRGVTPSAPQLLIIMVSFSSCFVWVQKFQKMVMYASPVLYFLPSKNTVIALFQYCISIDNYCWDIVVVQSKSSPKLAQNYVEFNHNNSICLASGPKNEAKKQYLIYRNRNKLKSHCTDRSIPALVNWSLHLSSSLRLFIMTGFYLANFGHGRSSDQILKILRPAMKRVR